MEDQIVDNPLGTVLVLEGFSCFSRTTSELNEQGNEVY